VQNAAKQLWQFAVEALQQQLQIAPTATPICMQPIKVPRSTLECVHQTSDTVQALHREGSSGHKIPPSDHSHTTAAPIRTGFAGCSPCVGTERADPSSSERLLYTHFIIWQNSAYKTATTMPVNKACII